MRHYSLFDQILCRLDKTICSLLTVQNINFDKDDVSNENPDENINKPLNSVEKAHSAALMRINHSGEVCAQALYLGQALVARNPNLANELHRAAQEEKVHLRWCKTRIKELGGRTSYLNPLWAMGSFGIGVIAGLADDKISLGFLAETEKQVSRHLAGHLKQISPKDIISRGIITQMKEDEEKHALFAITEGGAPLPKSICFGMKIASKVMTVTARYI